MSTEIGLIALLNVEEEIRLALGPAITLLQNMAVKSVMEKLRKHRPVTSSLVQVRNSSPG